MTTQDILELAARVEAAMGPDRELADEVLRAIGWRTETHGFRNINGSTEAVTVWLKPGQDFNREDFYWLAQEAATCTWSDDSDRRPDPTASLDAAMTLVPEGWPVRDLSQWIGSWTVSLDWPGRKYAQVDAQAKSAALALTAAALKARAHTKGEE